MLDFTKGLVRKPPISILHGLVPKDETKKPSAETKSAKPETKELTHPSGKVTGIDQETGLPIVDRSMHKTASNDVEKQESAHIGAEEVHTGRDILHQSNDPAEIAEAAKAEHPQIKKALKEALSTVDGAKLHGDRDEKPEERVDEKIHEEGQSPRTIPDFSGFRVAVDSHTAKAGAVDAIRNKLKVVREKDEFDNGAKDTGFHAHMLQVQHPGSDVTHEVQVLPKHVADTAEATHALYEKARSGDKDAAAEVKGKNEEAWKQFQDEQGEKKKYKFGNTQVDLPADSDAHKSVLAAQKSIPKEDLANDGTAEEADKPHLTVRYGLKDEDHDKLREFIKQQTPFTAKLGKTAAFPATEHSDGAVPIHAPVEAPELHNLNAEIEKHAAFAPSSFPEYKPHVTVAYVKPETADKHVGNLATDGKTFHVSSVSISDRDGNKESVPMLGKNSHKGESVSGKTTEQRAGAENSPAPKFKSGDRVKLKDGRRASVAYVPDDKAQLPTYRFKADDGKMVSMRAKDVHAGGAVPHSDEWIGFDLDKTLAHYDTYKGPTVIGQPIQKMVDRAKQHIKDGDDVRVLTARVSDDKGGVARKAIQDWTEKHIGKRLEITDRKDQHMKKLYDDRAVQVVPNEGTVVGETA
jgi:2'-5' RNA ligase